MTNAFIKEKERSQINNLSLHPKELERKSKPGPKFAEGRK